jgi:hypothetical protein
MVLEEEKRRFRGKVGRFLSRLGTGAKSVPPGRRWRSFVPGKRKNRAPAAEDRKTAGGAGGRALRTSADGPLHQGVRPMTRPLGRGSIRAVRSAGTPGGQRAADHPPEPPLWTLRRVHKSTRGQSSDVSIVDQFTYFRGLTPSP